MAYVSTRRQKILQTNKPEQVKDTETKTSKDSYVSKRRKSVLNKTVEKPVQTEPVQKEPAKVEYVSERRKSVQKPVKQSVRDDSDIKGTYTPGDYDKSKADDGKLTLSKLAEAVKRIPTALMNKENTQNQRKALFGDSSNNITPVDNSRYNVVGQNILPVYEEESAFEKISKGTVNYGAGTALRTLEAVPQAMMKTVSNIGNAIEGKPLDWSDKTLREDILPPAYDKALRELASTGKGGAIAAQGIDMLINMGLDPTTYIGGGIVDDLSRAGIMGKASKPSTEFVKVVGERQQAMLAKQAAKNAVKTIDNVVDAPIKQVDAEPIKQVEIKKPTVDELWEANNPVKAVDNTVNNSPMSEVETLKRIRMGLKEGTEEHKAISNVIDRLDTANKVETGVLDDTVKQIDTVQPTRAVQPKIEAEQVNTPTANEVVQKGVQEAETVNKVPNKVYRYDSADIKTYDTKHNAEEVVFFSADAKTAESFGGKPREFNVDMKNPLVLDAKGKTWQDEIDGKYRNEWVDEAKSNGNDGIIINNVVDVGGTTSHAEPDTIYAVFDGKQIKRADTSMPKPDTAKGIAKEYELNVKKAEPDGKIKDTDQIGIEGVNTRTVKGKDGNVEKMYSPYGQAWRNEDGTWGVQKTGQAKVATVANETEARKVIDSGMERTEVKVKKVVEESGQMEIGNIDKVEPSTDAEKNFVKQYTEQILPDDADELTQVIADLEQEISIEKDGNKLKRINLQLFAANEKLQKVSKFKTNTLRKTPDLADDEMQKIIDELDMTYGVKTHKETLRKAENMVNSNMQGTMNRIKEKGLESAEDTAASFLIEKALKEEAVKTGDYTKLKSWLKTVQVSGTKHGQTIEAFKLWQEDPDGMLKNATKTVEDAEGAMKKSNPEKIKQIDNETKKVIDEVDKVDKDTADGIADEVNKKADEIINGKSGKTDADGKTNSDTGSKSDGQTPKYKAEQEELKPEEMLANKIQNYIKEAKEKKDDPVINMVNELFKVAKESPIDKVKVKSKSAIEFVSEAIRDRQTYADTWIKAKSIVREKLKDNPEALATLEKYFDKGIRPPFSTKNFNKAVNDGMKELDLNIGEIVKNYYATGSESRKELAEYLVEKSGLKKQDAEALTKYVQNRMKELTKAKKEQILKGIFKDQTMPKAKPGALKSVEELSNVGAFVNNNYKDKVMEKLSPRLQKVINEKFKGVPTKASGAAIDDGRIDFGELVRKSTTDIEFTRVKFLKEISEKLQVNDTDAKTILTAVEKRFNEIVDEKRASILGNMFKKREATIKKTGIQRVQEYINKQVELENLGANSDAIRDFIKEKYGLPTLTNDDMAFITNHIEELKKLKVDSRPYNETLWRIYNRIESKVPSTFVDKFRAWQRISMLPNAKTFGRNILGNVFMEKIENFNELTTEALVDTVTSAFTGKREILGPTAAIQKSIAQTKGKLKGLSDTLTDIKHGVNTYDVQGQYEINVSKNAFKNPVLNALEQFTNRSLQFGDRPFYEAAKARRIAELKIIKKVKTVTDEMEADAILYALDRTFQNDSKLAKGVLKIKKAIDDPVYEAIANIIVPFAKTPANILDKISDYTPIGLVKAVGHLGKTAGKGTFDQKYFSQRLGRMLTGSGVITLGYLLAKNDVITGKTEKTTTKKGAFDKETGKLSYALKTDDGYVAYDWAQPIGSLLALGADAYGQGMNKGDVLKGLEGAGNTFFNMSMLQSLNSIMSYGNPMGGFISTMMGANQQFTPTGVKQTSKIFDKFERDTTGEGYWEETANKFKANIPILRQTLPAKTDTFGNPIEIQEGYGPLQKVINIAANPAIVTKSNMKDYEKEMDRLYNIDAGLKTKSDVLPSILSKAISDGEGTEYQLTPEQYNKYKKLYGDIAVKGLRDSKGNIQMLGLETIIRSKEYKELSDKGKAKKISGILSKAMNSAKSKMLKELKD